MYCPGICLDCLWQTLTNFNQKCLNPTWDSEQTHNNSEVLVFDPIRSVLKWILNSVCACETAEDGVQQQDLRNMIMHLQQIF
jgi:hypothetical protein